MAETSEKKIEALLSKINYDALRENKRDIIDVDGINSFLTEFSAHKIKGSKQHSNQ